MIQSCIPGSQATRQTRSCNIRAAWAAFHFHQEIQDSQVVDYEVGNDIYAAIAREKQIKGGLRQKKIDLINRSNPESKDLFEE
jgi:predicted GIY-YIG superfamily endonuclease